MCLMMVKTWQRFGYIFNDINKTKTHWSVWEAAEFGLSHMRSEAMKLLGFLFISIIPND